MMPRQAVYRLVHEEAQIRSVLLRLSPKDIEPLLFARLRALRMETPIGIAPIQTTARLLVEDGADGGLEDLDVLGAGLDGAGEEFGCFGLTEGEDASFVLDGGAEDEAEEDVEAPDDEEEPCCDEGKVVDVMGEDGCGGAAGDTLINDTVHIVCTHIHWIPPRMPTPNSCPRTGR